MWLVGIGITTVVRGLVLLLSQSGGSDVPAADVIPADTLTSQLPAALVLQSLQ